jgi:tRNA dimethylallyltransferase
MESLPDETARLEQAGLLGEQAREALGYKQVLTALRAEMSMDDAFERTKVLTRRFGKQQRTWLRRFAGVRWLKAEGVPAEELAEAAEACNG